MCLTITHRMTTAYYQKHSNTNGVNDSMFVYNGDGDFDDCGDDDGGDGDGDDGGGDDGER